MAPPAPGVEGADKLTVPPAIKVRSLAAEAEIESEYAVSPSTPLLTTAIDENGWVCGGNNAGPFGTGGQGDSFEPQPLQGVRRWAAISFGENHAAGVSCEGVLYTWGLSIKGQLGRKDEGANEFPKPVDELESIKVRDVACGAEHTVAVTAQDVYSWGSNDCGQLGQGDLAPERVPKPRILKTLHGKMVSQVVCGKCHTLAVTMQSHVYSWGRNFHGQLGLADRFERRTPTLVDSLWALPVKQLAAGDSHSAALTRSGYLFTWGYNQQGQLGIPPDAEHAALATFGRSSSSRRKLQKRVNQKFLTAMLDMGIAREKAELALMETKNVGVEMAAEWLFSAPDGMVEKQLEDERQAVQTEQKIVDGSDDNSVLAPRRVPLKGVRYVSAGSRHTVCVTPSAVYSWGSGDHGQLGTGTFNGNDLPQRIVALDGKNIQQVACGMYHTIFLTGEGDVYGCGSNECGQLGDIASTNGDVSYLPAPVKLKLPFVPEKPHRNQRKQPIVADISAGANASSFLTRAPDELPEITSQTLWEKLQSSIAGVENSKEENTADYNTRMHSLINAIEMVFGSAAALSVTFGYDDRVGLNVDLLYEMQKKTIGICDEKYVNDPSQGHLKSMSDLRSVSIVQAMSKAATNLVEDLHTHVKLLGTPERAQVLLAAAQHPLLAEQPFAKSLLPRLCSTILNAPSAARHLLVKWWADYPESLLENAVVQPLQSYVTKELVATKKLTVSVMNAIKVLAKVEESNDLGQRLQPEAFYNQLISEKMDVLDHYIAWRQSHDHPQRRPGQDGPFSFCTYPFLLDARAKSKLLHMEAKLQMEQTIAQSRMETVYGPFKKKGREQEDSRLLPDRKSALKRDDGDSGKKKRPSSDGSRRQKRSETAGIRGLIYTILRTSHNGQGASDPGDSGAQAGPSNPEFDLRLKRSGSLQLPRPEESGIPPTHSDMCILRIRRNHLTEDALGEIARQQRKDLFKPLRVHFIGEDGIDAGGVKKEFFQLLVHQLLSPDYGMLVYQAESRTYWFNPMPLEHEDEFFLIGLVLGLAVYNGVLLDFPLPMVLYKKLIGHDVGLRNLCEMQPTVGKSLQQLLQYEGPGSVEEVFFQTFSLDINVFGEVKTVSLKPQGEDIMVTEENRREYVDLYVDYVLNKSIRSPFEAFAKGFRTICGGPAIHLFNAQELERLVCGNPHLDFDALESNARYDGGFTKDSQTVRWLWAIAKDFQIEHKRCFLKFFTGSDRAPIGGLVNLKCIIQRDGTDSRKLPTSHTCFNTLLLPDYESRIEMEDRLQLAIMNAEGFGLE